VTVAKATCQPTNYPDEARRTGAAGQTEVEMEVNPEGKVTRVAITKSSGSSAGHQALDALALNTISKCTFPPAPGFLTGTGRMMYVWKLDS
jgi:TonB family protein